MGFKDDLKKFLENYDGEGEEGKTPEETPAEGSSTEETSNEEPKGDDEKKVSIDAAKAADDIVERIAKKWAEQQGGNSSDAPSARKHLFQTSESTKGDKSFDVRRMKIADYDPDTVKELSERYRGQKVSLRFTGNQEREWDAADLIQTAGFFKALIERDTAAVKAVSEGTDGEGGYLVPTPFRAELIRELFNFGLMRRIARIIPMTTDTLEIPTLAARPTAYWKTEHAVITTSSAEFGIVTMNTNVLITRIPASREVVADSALAIVPLFTELFGQAIAQKEDEDFFTGSGSGQPKGINQETLTTVAAGGVLDFDDMISLYYKLQAPHRNARSVAFVTHRKNIEILRKVKDSNNQYIWRPSVEVGQPDRVLGVPIFEQNDLAQDELYFGDWSYYLIGDRESISTESTIEGGTAWERHRVEIKAYERVDGRAAITQPFAKITGIQS